MTAFQIIAVCLLGAGTFIAIAMTIAFIAVSLKRESKVEEEVVQEEETGEIDLDEMLARLEEATKKSDREEKETPAAVVNVNVNGAEVKEEQQEVEEEPVVEPVVEEVKKEEPVVVVEEKQEEKVQEQQPTTVIINNFNTKEGPEFDYNVRLEKIKESQAKIERDLDKTNKNVLKYERTIRRKERNEKMLEKRALELTNLNLLMYSVTDIKNVDADKKARQEELTAHIAELKASIQDADEYIEANKEKYENNLKLQEYLTKEQKRYEEEIKELKILMDEGTTD